MRELLDLHQTISRALKQGNRAGRFSPQQVEQLTDARNVLGSGADPFRVFDERP
jgi:hypothetical protein